MAVKYSVSYMKKSAANLLLGVNIYLLKLSGVWDGFIKHVSKLMTKK